MCRFVYGNDTVISLTWACFSSWSHFLWEGCLREVMISYALLLSYPVSMLCCGCCMLAKVIIITCTVCVLVSRLMAVSSDQVDFRTVVLAAVPVLLLMSHRQGVECSPTTYHHVHSILLLLTFPPYPGVSSYFASPLSFSYTSETHNLWLTLASFPSLTVILTCLCIGFHLLGILAARVYKLSFVARMARFCNLLVINPI